MAGLWKKVQAFLESLEGVHDEDVKRIFMEFYWHLYKLTGFVADLTPTKQLIWTVSRTLIFVGTIVWHMILFFLTVPFITSGSHFLIRTIHFMLFVSFSLVMFFWFSCQRNKLISVHRSIAKGFHEYGPEGDAVTARLVKNFRKTYVASLAILPIVICSSAVFMFFSSAIDEATGSPPHEDPENGIDIDLPMPLWYPWDKNRWHLFQLAHELFLALYVGIIISASDLMFVNLSYTMCIQLQLLLISLKKIEKRTLKKYLEMYPDRKPIKNYDDPKFLRCYEVCLRKNVEHHQNVHRFFEDIVPLGNLPIFCAFGMEAMVLGMSALDLVTGGERIGDMILNIMLCLAEVANMAILCWYGQRVIDLSSDVRDSIYGTKWYLCSREVTSVLKVVQCRAGKPMTIMGGIWPCDLASFQAVMNSAYSYFNLLVASREK